MKKLFTGKAKELFEEYFSIEIHTNGFEALEHHLGIDVFYSFPLSMQIGVIEDFADSLGYDVYIGTFCRLKLITINYLSSNLFSYTNIMKNKEAREALIKELNNIINEKTK